jgi:hypothetical protein
MIKSTGKGECIEGFRKGNLKAEPLGRSRCRLEENIQLPGWRGIRLDGYGSGQGQMAGSCEHDTVYSGSIKCSKLFDKLKTIKILFHGVRKPASV